MPMKLDAHIENMYSMSSDLKMSTMKSDAGRPPSFACTAGSATPGCAAAGVWFAINAAAAPVAAPVRKLRRSTPGLRGFSIAGYPIIAVARCQFRAAQPERTGRFGGAMRAEKHRIARSMSSLLFGIGAMPIRSSAYSHDRRGVRREAFDRSTARRALVRPARPLRDSRR